MVKTRSGKISLPKSSSSSSSSYAPYTTSDVEILIDTLNSPLYFGGEHTMRKCLFILKDLIFRMEKLEKI